MNRNFRSVALFAALAGVVASCSPSVAPPPRAIIVPKESARVDLAPSLTSAAKAASDSRAAGEQSQRAGDAIEQADAAVVKAQRAGVPSDLKTWLAEARTQLGIARSANQASTRSTLEATATAEDLSQKLTAANTALAEQSRELAQYRQALPQANATISDDGKILEKLPGLIADKARNAVYRNWGLLLVGGVVGLAILASLGWVALQVLRAYLRPP